MTSGTREQMARATWWSRASYVFFPAVPPSVRAADFKQRGWFKPNLQHRWGWRTVCGRKVHTAGRDTIAGKHEPHLTPSLLSSTSPNKLVFWFLDSWQSALLATQRVHDKSICLGIIINLHAPPPTTLHPPLPLFSIPPLSSCTLACLRKRGGRWQV